MLLSFSIVRFFKLLSVNASSPVLIISACIALLIILISHFKINAFLAFLFISILAGLLLGLDVTKVTSSVQHGIGDMLGSLVVIVVAGAMLGKLVAESGAAQKIAGSLMKIFGQKNIQWALMITGFIIGIPLFYNVGFVLVIPLIFSVAYHYKMPALYVGLPIMASLSVTHGFLPPHPSPTALVAQLHADMGKTLFYGLFIAIPTVILAGPVFSQTLKKINPPLLKTFQASALPEDQLPGLFNSILSSITPVILLAFTNLLLPYVPKESTLKKIIVFLNDPVIVMLVSLLIAIYTLGIKLNIPLKKIMDFFGDAVKDISLILLIMSGAGALKQVMLDSGASTTIANSLASLNFHPLILGWSIACVIRLCVGSATVAGLTAAGIIAPLMEQLHVDPNLMVLSVGAGSLMFSHVNDSGFWMFKEYFNLTLQETIRSWSLMETIISIAGLIGVLIIDTLK